MENCHGFGKVMLAEILSRAPLCWESGKKCVKKHDVDFSFGTTLITKPISIKLKQKQLSKEENPIQIKKAATAVYLSGIYKTQLKSVPKC